jgi:hypothetical protein
MSQNEIKQQPVEQSPLELIDKTMKLIDSLREARETEAERARKDVMSLHEAYLDLHQARAQLTPQLGKGESEVLPEGEPPQGEPEYTKGDPF